MFSSLVLWLTGILLAEVVKHEHTSHLFFHHYIVWSLLLVSGVVLTYTGITFLGLDPLWSLDLAKKWCAKSEWVHPDTTPFFAFVRDVSSLIGKYWFCWIFLLSLHLGEKKNDVSYLPLLVCRIRSNLLILYCLIANYYLMHICTTQISCNTVKNVST